MRKELTRKIYFVAGLHGNEQAPVKALRDNGIDFILGNPNAHEKNIRFTESDLNASFGVLGDKYEEVRAKEILKEIDSDGLVIDFHTTMSASLAFAIVVDKNMIPLAARTGLGLVVLMSHNIKDGHALINHRDGISVESGVHNTKESYDTTLWVVENIKFGKEYPVRIYEVYDKITEPGEYVNFQDHPDGFIPVLAGEKAYNFYGLKAREIK